MAFTKINAAGIGTTESVTLDGLSVINNGSFGGNLTVGGVLTYEDVTNVDSVGLITARNGIVVGSGITLSKDGDVFFTGIATGNGSGLTALNASNLGSGTVPTARLGSGTASSSTFLRGDSTFQTVNTDLVSDTSPQLGGDLASNGNDILFADNDKAIFGTGSDLKIYHNGTDNYIMASNGHIRFDTGSAELARITSTGQLLVGTTSSSYKLHVDSTSLATEISVDNDASNYLVALNTTNSVNADFNVQHKANTTSVGTGVNVPLCFHVNGGTNANSAEKMRLDTSGRLLIGDSNAAGAALLQVQKTSGDMVLVRNDATNYESLILSVASGTADIYASSGGSTSRPALRFITNDSERLRIKSNGNVGIGDNDPSQRLVVNAGSDNSDVAVFTGGDVSRGLKISTSQNALNDQNIIYDAQGQYGQHIFKTGGDTIVGRFEHDQSGFITENVASGDGDDEVGVALQEDFNCWAVIYKNDWIGTGTGWGTFWAGSQGAAYRRESGDTNPNEHVMVGSGQKRFTFDLNDGSAYFDSSLSQNNYDYAEYFEWEDGNPSNEDRRGYSVFVNSNGKIEKATDSTNTSDIIGVISGTAMMLGDGAVYDWQGKWKVDEWGTVMREPAKQVSWKDESGKNHSYDEDKVPDGITIPSHATYKEYTRKILNSDFDETKVYVPRDKRQEWDPVGLLGKVRVRDDSPKNPNWKLIKIVNGKKLWLIR